MVYKKQIFWFLMIGSLSLPVEQIKADSNEYIVIGTLVSIAGAISYLIYSNDAVVTDYSYIISFFNSELKKMKLAPDVNIHLLARTTGGLTGTQYKNLIKMAQVLAEKENLDIVSLKHFDEAYNEIKIGAKHKYNHTDQQRRELAIHEAGHVVAFVYKGKECVAYKATIEGRGNYLGCVFSQPIDMYTPVNKNRTEIWKSDIIIDLAGGVAEQVFGSLDGSTFDEKNGYFNWELISGICGDKINASKNASRLAVSQETQKKIILNSYQETVELIKKHRKEVAIIADLLLKKETIYLDEIYESLGVKRPLLDYEENRSSQLC